MITYAGEPVTMENVLRLSALAYAVEAGIEVLPLVPGDKMPLIKKSAGGNGFHDATSDPEQVRAWWTRWPSANIGGRIPADMFVIDLDGDLGLQWLWEKHFALTHTLVTASGREGDTALLVPPRSRRESAGLQSPRRPDQDPRHRLHRPAALGPSQRAALSLCHRRSVAGGAACPELIGSTSCPASRCQCWPTMRRCPNQERRTATCWSSLIRCAKGLYADQQGIVAALRTFGIGAARRNGRVLDDAELVSIAHWAVREIAPHPVLVAKGPAGALRFYTPRELVTLTLPEPDWLIPGFLAVAAITEVDGKIKAAGKTTLSLFMVRAVLDGIPFLGQPTRQARVIYVTEQQKQTFMDALRRAGLSDRGDELFVLHREDLRGGKWPT